MKRMPTKPASAVHGENVERLVDARPRAVGDKQVAGDRADQAEHHRPAGADEPARGRDQDAADDDRGGGADRGHLPPADRVEEEPGDESDRRRQQRVGEREHALVARADAATAVESEPAKPQDPGAEQDEDGVVGQEREAAVILASADDERRCEGGEAGGHLDRDAAREVERAAVEEEAAAEDPVGEHGVDEDRPQDQEEEVGREAHPLDHGAGDERGRDDAEAALEGEEDEVRDRLPLGIGLEADVLEEGVAEVADEAAALAEGERVADERPADRHHAERGDRHHERVEGVLRANEPGVEDAEADGHEEDHRGRHQHPGGIARIRLDLRDEESASLMSPPASRRHCLSHRCGSAPRARAGRRRSCRRRPLRYARCC